MKQIGPKEYLEFLDGVESYLEESFLADAREIEHGQWELSFEAVLLKLLNKDVHEVKFNYNLVNDLAREAGLLDEGVLDPDTWVKFQQCYRLAST